MFFCNCLKFLKLKNHVISAFFLIFRLFFMFFIFLGKEEVTGSNPVNSSMENHAVSGCFRDCVVFIFDEKLG